MSKDLDIALSGYHFLDKAVDRRRVLLLFAVALSAPFRYEPHDGYDNGGKHDHYREQLHRQHQHHAHRSDKRHDGNKHLGYRMLKQLVRCLDIVREIAHEAAVGVDVEIAYRQLLHFCKKLGAQRPHYHGTALKHQPVQQIVRDDGKEIQPCKPDKERRIFCVYLVSRYPRLLQQTDKRLHAVGRGDRRPGVDKYRDHRADKYRPAVPEVPEKAHEASERRPRPAVAAQFNSRHCRSPPVSSGCRTRRGKFGCAT